METAWAAATVALVEFMFLKNGDLAKSGVRTLNFRIENFRLIKKLLDERPWEAALRDNRAGSSF